MGVVWQEEQRLNESIDSGAAVHATAPACILFCARCGASMHTREVGGRPRRACTRCDHVHFVEPRVGVGAMVLDEQGRILLIRRGMPPARGRWAVPAGYLDHGVDPRHHVAVEVREETGLEVAVGMLVDVFYNPPEQGGATVFLMYRASIIGGSLCAGDDADEAVFFAADELPEVAFASTRAALHLLAAEAGRGRSS